MVHLLDLAYRSELSDRRITRNEARAWMAEKKELGKSTTAEAVMWEGLNQYKDAFDPGVKEEVEAFLAQEAKARYRAGPSFFERLGSLFFGPRDSDRDGLDNDQERKVNTNPFRADTDGDGFSDAAEVRRGSHPGVFIPR